MKRIHWTVISVVALTAAGGVVWFLRPGPSPPAVDHKVLTAFTQKGGTYGQMREWHDAASGDPATLHFQSCDPHESIWPASDPAFRFSRFDGAQADELPQIGRPFGLDLSGSGFSDQALVDAAKFTHLARLNLTQTAVSDTGMERLAGCTNLTHLSLRGTRVSDFGIKYLAALTNLTYLDLRGTKVTGPGLAHLSSLNCLVHIDLRDTLLSGQGMTHLAALPALTELDLNPTQVSDDVVAALGATEKLYLLYPVLRRRPGRDADIDALWLAHSPISDAAVERIAALPSLSRLDLGGTQVTDLGMQPLADHPKIVTLAVSETKVTVAGIRRLIMSSSLKYLYLSDDQVTDDLMASLAADKKVHLLINRVGGVGVPHE